MSQKSTKTSLQLFNNRMQRLKIGSTYSSAKQILLFNIFINDLFVIELDSQICNFADDTAIYACDTPIEAVMLRLESDMHMILQWLKDNGTKANLGGKATSKLCLNIKGLLIP